MKTFNNMESAFAHAQDVANRTGDLVCVMARDTRSQPEPWGVCADADATMHVNAWWSPWSHWANVRPTESSIPQGA